MAEVMLVLLVLLALAAFNAIPARPRWVFNGRRWMFRAFVFLLLPVVAQAETVRVNVIHRTNAVRGLNRQEAREVFSAARRQIFEETGVRLTVGLWRAYPVALIRVPKNPGPLGPHMYGVSGSDVLLDSLPPARITLVISPRYRWGGKWWSTGVAAECSDRALAIVGRLKRYGPLGLRHAEVVVTHELGHALGAGHSGEPCQVMHPAAGGELERCGWSLPFSGESVGEIAVCVGER